MEKEIQELLNEINQEQGSNEPEKNESPEQKQENVVNEGIKNEENAEIEESQKSETIEDNVEKIKRAPREPKMIPAWKSEVEKKKLLKKAEEEKNALLNELNKLRSEIENLKSGFLSKRPPSDKEVSDLADKVKELSEKYNVDYNFLNDILSLIPKPKVEIPKEIYEKLEEFERLKEENKLKQEDLIFEDEFNKYIVPKIKEKKPFLSDKDIENLKQLLKNDYFSERYITLDIDEIYKLREDYYDKFLPKEAKSVEKKDISNVSRQVYKGIDYSSLTEEEFAKLPPEEQDKVIDFLSKRRV